MTEIRASIVITGLVCLTIIYISLLFCKSNTDTLSIMIVGAIAMAIGVVIPSPKVDNKMGVLRW